MFSEILEERSHCELFKYPYSSSERTVLINIQVHPIAAAEIEVSIMSYEEETKKGVT